MITTIAMDEVSARRVVLAQAIETADLQGRLVSQVEREQIDRQAIEAAGPAGEVPGAAAITQFLKSRAALVLQIAGNRDRAVAALQERSSTERWITAGLPLAALALGIFTDQIANPHQVNLLSKPLLLLLLWNVAVYLVLFVNFLLARRRGAGRPRFAPLREWLANHRDWRRRPGHLRTEVTAAFLLRWHALTAGLYAQRMGRVMHLAAAAWALGVALSLFFGGFLASYVVQWESTFLTADGVHRFLSILFLPVTLLFPDASFSLEEVRNLRAVGPMPSPPVAEENLTGRRWVLLYTMLLALVVVLPRLGLAAWAWWRERKLARSVRLDLADGYYQRLVASLSPARVQLGVYAHRGEDRAALLRVLLHRADAWLPGVGLGQGDAHELLKGPAGELLRVLDLPHVADPALLLEPRRAQGPGWGDRLRDRMFGRPPEAMAPAASALRAAQAETDVLLHVVSSASDLQAAAPLLQWLDKPVVVLVTAGGDEPADAALLALCRAQLGAGSAVAAVLGFDQFARCWIQERVLLDAVGRCLPPYKAPGFARLAAAWDQRNFAHLREAMSALAGHLLFAARQSEDVGKPPNPLVATVRPGESEAHERRSREAMATIVERLQQSDGRALSSLRLLHGIGEMPATALGHSPQERAEVVRDTISATQAGAAGAASGAALGVSIDLLTAGLSLGLAAAAGALVGGGAAWVAAVWKNKTTSAGTAVVQLSDDMLQALVEAALLRYLVVIHFQRDPHAGGDAGIRPGWRSEVVAAVERRSDDLKAQWAAVRSRQELLDPAAALVSMLESIALDVLQRLYPATPPS